MDTSSVAALLRARAAEAGDRVAYGHGREGATIRYAALAAQAAAWGDRLREAGVGPGHRVGLLAADPLAFAGTYLSLLAAGLTVVPLDPGSPEEQVWSQLALLHVDVLLTDRAELASGPCPTWALGAEHATAPIPPAPARALSGPAVLLTSSGTTGKPKVVPLTERQLLYVAGQVATHHRLDGSDRGYSPLPLFHVNAQVVGLLSTLVSGGSLVLDSKFHRTGFWDLLEDWQVTWCNAVPAILAILVQGPGPAESTSRRLRFVRTASAPLPVSVLSQFESHCDVSVLETYGMSEAASQITANPLPRAARRTGSAGRPVGVRLRVVDSARRPCPPGEIGSVELRGASVIDDYIAPGATEGRTPARAADGWLVSGDLGYRDDEGFLYLAGRADDVINRGGEKIYPREIEEVLVGHAAVAEVAVVAQRDPVLGECPVAYVTARGGTAPAVLSERLLALCASRLAPARRPARLLVVDELPKGPTGKVLRRRLAPPMPLVISARAS